MAMVNIPVEPPVTEYLHAKASRLHIPLSGTFELTPVCNMNCKMCYVRMSRAEQEAVHPLRTAEEWLELGKNARDRGMLYLLLTGGEPFLRPDFREILSGLHQMGLLITINSNGTLIDEETVEWLKESPPVRINITLYGASDETYEILCGNPEGFTQVTKAIRLLKEAGITVKINCSLTPYNAGDLEKIFAFCKEEQLIIQATSYMFPPIASGRRHGREEPPLYAGTGGLLLCKDRSPHERGRSFFKKNGGKETGRPAGRYRRGLPGCGRRRDPVPGREVQLLGDLGWKASSLRDAAGERRQ